MAILSRRRRSNNWAALPFFLREAIYGMLVKLALLLCCDFAHPDRLDDMIGYLALARKLLSNGRERKRSWSWFRKRSPRGR